MHPQARLSISLLSPMFPCCIFKSQSDAVARVDENVDEDSTDCDDSERGFPEAARLLHPVSVHLARRQY